MNRLNEVYWGILLEIASHFCEPMQSFDGEYGRFVGPGFKFDGVYIWIYKGEIHARPITAGTECSIPLEDPECVEKAIQVLKDLGVPDTGEFDTEWSLEERLTRDITVDVIGPIEQWIVCGKAVSWFTCFGDEFEIEVDGMLRVKKNGVLLLTAVVDLDRFDDVLPELNRTAVSHA